MTRAQSDAAVRVIPLGGLGEVGKNITVIEQGDDFIVIDCGITFPREQGVFGVDIVLPDFSWIEENVDRLRAVILTHGHEDHIGALPYLMKLVDVPQVWGTRFTLGLVKAKVDEHGLIGSTDWQEIVPENDPVNIGPFELEFVRVAHSIPDAVAVAVHTSEGTIFHTGDLRLDPSPLDGVQTDLARIAEIGSDGISLYLGDSTNAEIPGHNRSEMSIGGPLRDIVARAPGRVIAACFSSHIHRIQQFCDIAAENGRKVCLLGRSMTRNTNIARNLHYMDVDKGMLVKPQRIGEFDPQELFIICTGSQGEPLAAMSRYAWGSHPFLKIDSLDTVIFSSRTIPGNETSVHRTINELSRVGVHIHHSETDHIHVSGHAASEELKILLQLARPDAVMPVHGEWRHLRAHADLARMVGIDETRIIHGENGAVVELNSGEASLSGEFVTVGQTLVDRNSRVQILDDVLDDRQQLSGEGVLVVVAHGTGDDDIEIIARGLGDHGDLIDDARIAASEALMAAEEQGVTLDDLAEFIETTIVEVFTKKRKRSPLIVPVVLRQEYTSSR